MSRSPRIGIHLWPGGTPGYATWRQAVIDAEALGADAIFGYDHFHKPFVEDQRRWDLNCLRGTARVNNFEDVDLTGVLGRDHHTAPTSGCSSAGSDIAILTCWPTWLAPSTTSAAAA